jgi:phosphoribosylformylglycinamidine cyclo-ligase
MTKGSKGKDLYRSSGVDIDKGDHLVDWLQESRPKSRSSLGEVVSGIGGFAALFRPNLKNYEDPLIISCTDGVGTKLLLAIEHNSLESCGIDLVAMCVNDLYCLGGRPLFFLDYYATGILDEKQFQAVIKGIRRGLELSDCPLLGGETAELPGLYAKGHLDLAGFVVGMVDRPKMIGPDYVKSGDLIYGLKSTGFHSNGYSLVRKFLDEKPGSNYLKNILEPTAIYAEIPEMIDELSNQVIHAAANITGGGISGNIERVIPENLCAEIDPSKIPTPLWMKEFIHLHCDDIFELETTLNLGLGMALIVDQKEADRFEAVARQKSDRLVGPIGKILTDNSSQRVRYI